MAGTAKKDTKKAAKQDEMVKGDARTNETQDGTIRAKRTPEPVDADTLETFTVRNASIKDAFGRKCKKGEIVQLTPELAKHYNKLDCLSPYIPDDED